MTEGRWSDAFDFTDGNYPVPKRIEEGISSGGQTEESQTPMPTASVSEDSDETNFFWGKLLDVVPSYNSSKYGYYQLGNVAHLFIGNGMKWGRVNLRRRMSHKANKFIGSEGDVVLSVRGYTRRDGDIKEIYVPQNDDDVEIETTDSSAHFSPRSTNPRDVEPEMIVPILVGEIFYDAGIGTHPKDGEEFDVRHLLFDSNGTKFKMDIFDSHRDIELNIPQTACVFSVYAKDIPTYDGIPSSIEYRCGIQVKDYSGIFLLSE